MGVGGNIGRYIPIYQGSSTSCVDTTCRARVQNLSVMVLGPAVGKGLVCQLEFVSDRKCVLQDQA